MNFKAFVRISVKFETYDFCKSDTSKKNLWKFQEISKTCKGIEGSDSSEVLVGHSAIRSDPAFFYSC